jgi:hypothetical protein
MMGRCQVHVGPVCDAVVFPGFCGSNLSRFEVAVDMGIL